MIMSVPDARAVIEHMATMAPDGYEWSISIDNFSGAVTPDLLNAAMRSVGATIDHANDVLARHYPRPKTWHGDQLCICARDAFPCPDARSIFSLLDSFTGLLPKDASDV